MLILKISGLGEGCLKEMLTLDCMYWAAHRCAVSVTLPKRKGSPCRSPYCTTDNLINFPFDVPCSHPHVSLAKHTDDKWQDLGPWVLNGCVDTETWEQTSDPYVQYNPTLKVYRHKISCTVHYCH